MRRHRRRVATREGEAIERLPSFERHDASKRMGVPWHSSQGDRTAAEPEPGGCDSKRTWRPARVHMNVLLAAPFNKNEIKLIYERLKQVLSVVFFSASIFKSGIFICSMKYNAVLSVARYGAEA
jgi:hypothetical protein